MAFQFHKIPGFTGLSNRKDARDIGNGLSKAQNISLDIGGKIRTIGGLADFTKVDGATALTQTAKIAPGSGLFTYGSDHWVGGVDTIADILAADNAASDEGGEVNAVGSWTAFPGTDLTLSSVADTDGAAIASNGTTYIMKGVVANNADEDAYQSVTTVIGQKYIVSGDLYNVDLSSMKIQIGTTVATPGDIASSESVATGSWANRQLTFTAIGTTTFFFVEFDATAGATGYFDDFYVSKAPRRDLDTNWLALVDAAAVQVDLYDFNSDSFTAGLLDFGTVSSYVATIDTINFPTTKTITDSTSQFLNQGVQTGDIRIISGSALNNIAFVVEHVTAGTIRARGNPFVVDVDDDGTVTLTKYNPVAFHYVNEALRASPANGGIALRPKHYSFADRTHFEGAGASEREFADWYANDVGPVAPTSASAHTTNGNVATQAELVAGTGFEVGITTTADDGEWTKGTYIIACFFTYDDGQMSALYVPSTDEEFGTTIVDGDSLTITVRGKMSSTVDYDERISGGGVCCRLDESDEPWSLLADISMAKGARATLSGTYNAWAESSTEYEAYTANFKSLNLNLDSYESLAGIDPTTTVETFSGDNAFWNASVIGGNRCFIFAPRYTDAGGNLQQFRDRIMYSQVNAYDTFPIDNIIDVVKGDAEDYVVGGIYGNDLLAFKSRTLYIIDISDPDPAGWQMKQDKNKGKYPRRGVAHPGAYFETPHGPAWCNEFGVFLYNGSEIVPLLGDKIELSEHPLAYQRKYEFDGTNDVITKSDDADLDMGIGDFSFEAIARSDVVDSLNHIIYSKGQAANPGMELRITSTNKWGFDYTDSTPTTSTATSDSAPTANQWTHVLGTADRSDAVDGTVLYVAGVAQADTGAGHEGDLSNAVESSIGRGTSTLFWDGDIALVRIWNRALSASEVLALANGQPVLAADQWGSQTDKVTDGDMSNAASWSIGGQWTVDDGGSDVAAFTSGGGNSDIEQDVTGGLVVGKKYRVRFTVAGGSGNARIGFYSDVGATAHSGFAAYANGTHNVEFAAAGTADDFEIYGQSTGDSFTLDNVSLVQIGCVAEFAPKNISDATWTDESTNDLDGTVVGATAIYEDSWAKFWTNYSILGHHARTNQLIINRDCTGKWSSGQDYGDVWIIDLDTGASTTGRRVFTKGIAYSNWATDWNQELIIAEQTSSTSVTIKQWTDEPQSQAAGLIDVRTADFDFGNPMFAKIFDALAAFYKSSAAQTTPVSYALDGDDRQTAWTRITGNFDAEGFWEKLTLEPTPIEIDTIRFKLDNPTAAGTMELNDMTLRYQTEEEDID